MQIGLFLLWSIAAPAVTWFLLRRQYRLLLDEAIAVGREAHRAAAAAQTDLLEERNRAIHIENQNAQLVKSERHLSKELQRELAVRAEAQKRAETAEGIVRGQAKHIEALQRSNETMLASIVEMRRVGFALPSDVLNDPDPEITTVGDDDLAAVKEKPEWIAGDDD